MPQRVNGIVFDLDGTLIDSLSLTFDAFNRAMREFGGREHSPKEIIGYSDYGTLFRDFLGPEKGPLALRACLDFYNEMGPIPLHDGVAELLDSLHAKDVAISIFTGRGKESTERILAHHRIRGRFIAVVTDDHVGQKKPSPEGLHQAARAMKLSADQVIFVGDSSLDIRAARAGGATAVAALWDGLTDRALLEPHGPHHWANRPGDVLEIWKAAAR